MNFRNLLDRTGGFLSAVSKPVPKGKIIKDDIEDINFMKYTAVE